MKAAGAPRVLLCAKEASAVEDVRRLLVQEGYVVGDQAFDGAEAANLQAQQLVVLDSSHAGLAGPTFCRRLRNRLGDCFVPILAVTSDPSPSARFANLESGADANLLRPFVAGELLAQVRAFLHIKNMHDRLAEKSAEVHHVNKRLQQAYQQIDEELELARKLQLSFLPQSLPEMPRARFAVRYRLCGQVGGDCYDVFRLDENHVGFYVADAVGHGVPASLLTIFVKKGVQAKEIFGKQYRLLLPNEVLQRLNRDLVEQAISENPFITMIYVLLNCEDGTLQFSRAGHPHPLYLPRDAEPRFLQIHGSLLGVFDTEFSNKSHRLRTGDKLLLYSDGIDTASFDGRPAGAESVLACASKHRSLPVQELVDRMACDLMEEASQPDDLTLLGVEIT